MDFTEAIIQFSKKIKTISESITTEEATKTSLIMPVFNYLGYDVFNPLEFCPEYTADVGIKKGEKRGEKRGEKKGENRLGTLMNILLKNKRYSDAEKASEDEEYREELYKEYKL